MKSPSELTTNDFTVKGLDDMTRQRLEGVLFLLGLQYAFPDDASLFTVLAGIRNKVVLLQREAAR